FGASGRPGCRKSPRTFDRNSILWAEIPPKRRMIPLISQWLAMWLFDRLVIGSKILSGRTKDQNVGYIAEYLTALGIDLKEVRVVGKEERASVDALNELRYRCTYVFTTGGIGPTHADI